MYQPAYILRIGNLVTIQLLVWIGESIASRFFLQNGKTEQKKTGDPARHFNH